MSLFKTKFLRITLWAFILNTLWELGQCLFFYNMVSWSFWKSTIWMGAAIFGDVLIVLGLWKGACFLNRLGQFHKPSRTGYVVLPLLSFSASIVLEWIAIYFHLWSYNVSMPVIELLNHTVGLLPILQITTIPALSVWLANNTRPFGEGSKKPFMVTQKYYTKPSVFQPENLLREARRQKSVPECDIPEVCVLDPDGDIIDYLQKNDRLSINRCWSGYHTRMYEFDLEGATVGIIGQAVGASFAVLLAEQMFVSGCKLLISMTSAGIVNQSPGGKKFILIEEALRDEGTSYHYLPPEDVAAIAPELRNRLLPLQDHPELSVARGKSWTTDAPYRETQSAINYAKSQGVTAVEMEAAALYAFAKARRKPVVCFAHLTNTMAQQKEDFEKGIENGSIESLRVIAHTLSNLNFG